MIRSAALTAMEEAERIAPGPVGPLNPIPAQRARLQLAQGDLAGAARWTQRAADGEPRYPAEPTQPVLARMLLAQDQPGRALALLEWLHEAAYPRTG